MKATFRHTRSPPITLDPYSTNPGRLPRLRKPSRFALRQLAAEVRLLLDRLGRFLVGGYFLGDDAGLGGTRLLGRGVGVAPLTLALSTVGAVLPLALRAVRRERLSLSLPLGCLPQLCSGPGSGVQPRHRGPGDGFRRDRRRLRGSNHQRGSGPAGRGAGALRRLAVVMRTGTAFASAGVVPDSCCRGLE